MKKVAKVGDITYEWEDSPDLEDHQAQQRLGNLRDLAISIGRCEGLLKSSLPLPEDKSEQESGRAPHDMQLLIGAEFRVRSCTPNSCLNRHELAMNRESNKTIERKT